ncbi:RHS repeat-associated core domain-containing protein [Archangium primigenium]|uniref:RHS repeat-associated core domain-containing protein n=1 Tax=[Archangium] primigenium TaxID=2792470 RepID=UPI0019598F9E|nr:RHS repeat-associated core domain-containing protein [Archangium primigenium]MBM7112113.1 VCBS repeat-containing protein [Archangium primigenium]
MFRSLMCLGLLLALPASAQTVNDYQVQAPELTAPQRGSLVGQYASTAFGPADVSRGGFSLSAPFVAPTERGPLLGPVFPSYSPDNGISEWGQGWRSAPFIVRSRVLGDLDYATDELTGPWGRMVQGHDGFWYPQGLSSPIRVEPVPGGFIAHLQDGSRWTFGGAARIQTSDGTYAWYLTEVVQATGYTTRLAYTANASGRLFLQSVLYGGMGPQLLSRVDFVYEPLTTFFSDLRSGSELVLDRRIQRVEMWAKDFSTGTFAPRWFYELGYVGEGLGPTFLLTSVQQVFASGERAPVVSYEYEQAEPTLTAAPLRATPAFDTVLNTYSPAVVMPTRSSVLDEDLDGWTDLEERTDFTLIRQGPQGFSYEPLPAAPADARVECRAPPSTGNYPRTLARMRADVSTHQVVRLLIQTGRGQTKLLLCERDGAQVHESTLQGTWSFNATTRLADLNRDRQPDVLRVFRNGYWVIPNQSTSGGYAFGSQITGSLDMNFTPSAIWVQDFNGDGLPDLIMRNSALLVVYRGRGNFRFEPTGQIFRGYGTAGTVDLSRYQLSFVDANRDGLTDVLINTSARAFLLVNVGDRLVEKAVPGLNSSGLDSAFPIVQDFAGTGNTEVFFAREGKAHSVALNTPGTGLLKGVEDGKGTRLEFLYGRGPSAPGSGVRQSVLDEMTVKSSGQDAVTYHYDYQNPRVHSVGGFPLGYATVSRTDARTAYVMDFRMEDHIAGLPVSSVRTDVGAPQVRPFESWEYQDVAFQGFSWPRPSAKVKGWMNPSGTQRVSERTDYVTYTAEVCPSQVRITQEHGTLVSLHTRASLSGWSQSLHCLDSYLEMMGTHTDSSLDFHHESRIERNQAGLMTKLTSVVPGQSIVLQEVAYNPDFSVSSIAIPGRGVMGFDYERRMLRQVTSPEGVVTQVTERHPVTDAILAMELDRGGTPYEQFFRFDGQERLSRQWDSLGGTDLNPKEAYAYRYATANAPGSVFVSQLVDAASASVREFIDYSTASGASVTTARLVPGGWVFDGVVERLPSLAQTHTSMRPGMAASVDMQALDYATLLAGSQRVSSSTSAFGSSVFASTRFHDTVEQQLATSLGLDAGRMTRTVLENGTWSRRQALDSSARVVESKDEANVRTGFRYDALGRLRQVDLPDGRFHRVTYDAHGRVSSLLREDLASVEYVYAPVTGLLTAKRYGNAVGALRRQLTLGYDALGRVSTETYSDVSGAADLVYRYYRDGATPAHPGLRTALGLVSAIEGRGYLKLLEYRPDARLERSVLRLDDWRSVETQLFFTEGGEVRSEVTSVREADGTLVSTLTKGWVRDAYGRLSELWLNGVPKALLGYDTQGQPQSMSFPGGQVTLGYDPLTRRRVSLSQVGPGWTSSSGLQLNARGLLDVESVSAGGTSLSRVYGYSSRGFLSSSTDAQHAYAYGFDSSGLPSSIEEGGVRRDLLRSGQTLTAGGVTYTFDDQGRAVSRDDLAFRYGPDGNLAAAGRDGVEQWSFLYDEKGQRLMKFADGVPVAAYLDQGLYLDATGLTQPLHFGGQLVGLVRGGDLHLVATDLRGTVIADEDGSMRLASPFGDRSVRPALSAVIDYVQKGHDADLGLIRMGVRDYDPKLNRFLTPDPLFLEEPGRCVGSPVECNLYGYARNNPLRYADPSGMAAWDFKDLSAGATMGTIAAVLPAGSMLPVPPDQSESFYVGYAAAMTAGTIYEGIVSISLMVGGGGMMGGGGALSATGVGAAPGIPAMAAGYATFGAGLALGADTVADARHTFQVLQMANKSGKGGGEASSPKNQQQPGTRTKNRLPDGRKEKGPSNGVLERKDPQTRQLQQQRRYDSDGKPVKDCDYDHHPELGTPHVHDWKYEQPQAPNRTRQDPRSLEPGETL